MPDDFLRKYLPLPLEFRFASSSTDGGAGTREFNIGVLRAVTEVATEAIGPNSMHKLFSGTYTISTDGLTLVKDMKFRSDQPIVNALLKALEDQDREFGDGCTRMLLLIGSLLEEAEKLIAIGIHPSRIAQGFTEASAEAVAQIEAASMKSKGRSTLLQVAKTASAGKGFALQDPTRIKYLIEGACAAAKHSAQGEPIDRDAIAIDMTETALRGNPYFFRGMIIYSAIGHPAAPKRLKKAKIAIVDFPLDLFNKPQYASRLVRSRVEANASLVNYRDFVASEARLLEAELASIARTGADVLVSKRGIGDRGMARLAGMGIMAIERVIREADIHRLSMATGARVAADPSLLDPNHLGHANLVEEVELSGKKIVVVHGVASSPISTFLIAGAPQPSAAAQKREAETVLGSLFTTIENGRVVPGGGATEAGASRFLKTRALSLRSKKQLAYGAFAEALMTIPRNLATTTGVPFFRYLSGLENPEHGMATGFDVRTKSLADMYRKGVVDPLQTVTGYIGRAAAFTSLIINTDYTLRTKKPLTEKEAKQKSGANDSRDSRSYPTM